MKKVTDSCGKIFPHGWECASCGNHVCGSCAVKNSFVCPACYGRLYRTDN
ncbi:MAG: hypothetical protein LUF82_06070 [Clostridia bacterium]|nr:hypothetical protein [Clostridia bacterium]